MLLVFPGVALERSQYVFRAKRTLQELKSQPMNRLPHRRRYVLRREENHPAVRIQRADAPGSLNAIQPAHADVAEQHIRAKSLSEFNRFFTAVERYWAISVSP